MNFIERIIKKIADLIWKELEPRIVAACEEGFKRGENYGYVSGHEDGQGSGADDIIRRMTYVYDFVRHAAEADVYLKSMENPIEEIPDDEFKAIVDDMENV